MFEAEWLKQGQGPVKGDGICAVVLFDYEATESIELTLHEGEIVQNIEELEESEGWWIGATEGGQGIFPANYVQLVQSIPLSKSRGLTAVAIYDYDAAEDNELSFREGDVIWGIETGSDEWWVGKVGQGSEQMGPGLFPSNYVELVESTPLSESQAAPSPEGLTAVAVYDYDAAEDDELSFKEGDVIWGIETGSDQWWSGKVGQGAAQMGPGLFPANYVELVESTESALPRAAAAPTYEPKGLTAVAIYDFHAIEDDELSFREGDLIWGIEGVSLEWWSGKVGQGTDMRLGLFPANYVKLVESIPPSESALEGPTAVAVYDYDATEDSEISFREGDVIWGIEVVSDEWWNGKVGQGAEETDTGLFPADYVMWIRGGVKEVP